jgi:hypothetical protein
VSLPLNSVTQEIPLIVVALQPVEDDGAQIDQLAFGLGDDDSSNRSQVIEQLYERILEQFPHFIRGKKVLIRDGIYILKDSIGMKRGRRRPNGRLATLT